MIETTELTVSAVANWLDQRTPEEARDLFHQLSATVVLAWAGRALCALHIVEAAGRGERGLEAAAELLGLSRGHTGKLVQAARVVREKLAAEGDGVTFELEEAAWYQIAAQVASEEKPAIEYIAEAEARHAEDPTFSPSQWRRELTETADEGSTTAEDGKLWRTVSKLARFEDAEIDEAVKYAADVRKRLAIAEDAASAIGRVVEGLRGVAE
jgi:hypothetical protein